jgi:hypothetical protein
VCWLNWRICLWVFSCFRLCCSVACLFLLSSSYFLLFSLPLFCSVFLFLSFIVTKGWKKKNLCSPLLSFFVPLFFLPAEEVYVAISSY